MDHLPHIAVQSPIHYCLVVVWSGENKKTLPKALRTQALTALTSNFGLVGLVRWVWIGRFDLVGFVW